MALKRVVAASLGAYDLTDGLLADGAVDLSASVVGVYEAARAAYEEAYVAMDGEVAAAQARRASALSALEQQVLTNVRAQGVSDKDFAARLRSLADTLDPRR